MQYENVIQTDLFGNVILATLMSGRKYAVIFRNADCSRQSNVRTLVFEAKSVIKTQRRYRTQCIATYLISALPGNSYVNTVQHKTIDEAVFSM
jgi:hypothetical protein